MNCFQFDYFCGYHTASKAITLIAIPLWIAFNLITFVDITQPAHSMNITPICCELLSIWLLLWISHSTAYVERDIDIVVNCFQFDYFCGYHTAVFPSGTLRSSLWIAFNLITFVDITQHYLFWYHFRFCCELLSIWLLLWISHSCPSWRERKEIVVNCFQFDYFCGYHTAPYLTNPLIGVLWIAFNLITFVDITQLTVSPATSYSSCELLSIWLLLWISHSVNKSVLVS